MRPAFRRDERQFRDLIEKIPALAWSALADGSNTFVSKRWTEYTGLSAEDTAGWGWRAAVHPDDIDRYVEKWRSSLSSGEAFEDEARIRRAADGEYRWFLARAEPLRDERGSILAWYGMLTDIEDHKRAEQALRTSEERFRSLTELLSDWYWRQDENLRFTYLSSQANDLTGYSGESSYGKTRWELVNMTPLSGSWDEHKAVLAARQPFRDLEACRIGTDGMPRYLSMSGAPIFDQEGHFKGYHGIGRNITERKRDEAALRQRAKELRELIETMPAIAWTISADGSNVFANSHWTEYSGLPAQALSGSAWLAAIHPDELDLHVQKWRASVTTGLLFENEARLRRAADGEYRWFLVRAMPLQDDGGKVLQWYGVAMDVEDRKRAEKERAEHLKYLESMDRINRAMQGTNDLEQMMSDVLDAVLEIFGCDRAWLVYPCDPEAPSWRPVMEHTRPEFPGAFAEGADLPMDPEGVRVFESALASGGPVLFGSAYDLQLPAQVAERFGIQSQMAMAVYPKGDKPYLFGLHQCSHPRVWTTQEQELFRSIGGRLTDSLTSLLMFRSLRESEAKLEEAQRIAHLGHWERDFATGRWTVSDESRRIFGVSPEEATAERAEWAEYWLNLIHPDDRERMRRTVAAAQQSGEPYDTEYRVVRPDGEMRVVHTRASVTRDESDRPLRMLGMLQDITERKHAEAERAKLEERLRQAEKLEAIGRFASGIAHDFNNVLGGITAYGEMLFDDAPENSSRKRYAQNVLIAATRGRDLVDQILAYTRSQRGKRAPIDVCRTVAETLDLIRSSLPASITMYATIPDVPVVVSGNATQLHQIVTNLCSNAIHAMQAGGPLRVAITPLDVGADRALSHGTLRPGAYARLSVEDGGCGMDEATLARIFEPFFTTREGGRGTGLGLALVSSIIAGFGGVIDVKSVPDEGSTFSIYMPLADVPNAAVGAAPPEVVGR